MSHKKNYCTNCGKFGHINRTCKEPITSLGILCFKLDKSLNLNHLDFNNYVSNKYIKIDDYNFENLSNLNKINLFKDKIYFLLIRRKHSLNYVEFIRGKYDKNNLNKLIECFELMSKKEIENIKNNDFEFLWDDLWKETSKNKMYQKEFKKSKKLFNNLKEENILEKLLEINPLYDTPEWGIPKGRRNYFEKNIECAIREFNEETTMKENNYVILKNLYSVQENYKGTNNLNYKHIYYLSISDSANEVNYDNIESSNNEIGNIGWFTWDEAIKKIRPYYKSKIELINKIFLFILNIYIEIIKDANIFNKFN
jgi:8-oxo-dGTP pyrophosphatase MutT (NUDIX family)